MILPRLKAETQAAHDRVEALMHVMDTPLSRTHYVQTLRQLHRLYVPLEAQLAAQKLPEVFAFAERRKTDRLVLDLSVLGGVPGPATTGPLPTLLTPAHALGALYVLEGATLGGQLITRHVHRQLGLTALSGAAFFSGYGPDTGRMWRQFTEALTRYAQDTGQDEAIVEGARRTFAAFEAALQEGALYA
ncbi:biliverdin-producing heme oxygenase [Deinococcus hohokamensis]|uniref:Biliverdin-producing heme oxygenase n=1 Tax=Deinococcus hohokamensis TaxID=309883 RepID=A0ABV9I857_9DEIO